MKLTSGSQFKVLVAVAVSVATPLTYAPPAPISTHSKVKYAVDTTSRANSPATVVLPGERTWGTQDSGDSRKGGAVVAVLDRISGLSDGWLGVGTLAPSTDSINHLKASSSFVADEAHVAAAGDGSIVIEWQDEGHDYLVSLERDSKLVFIEETTDGDLVRELEEEYSDGRLRQFLRGLAE